MFVLQGIVQVCQSHAYDIVDTCDNSSDVYLMCSKRSQQRRPREAVNFLMPKHLQHDPTWSPTSPFFFQIRSKLSMLGIALDSGMASQVNVELPGNWKSIVTTAENTNIFHFEGFRDCLMLMMFILWGESCGNQSHLYHGSVVAALHACAVRAVRPLTAPGAVACPQWPGAFWLGVVRPGESRVDLHWISQAVWKEHLTGRWTCVIRRMFDIWILKPRSQRILYDHACTPIQTP